MPGCQVCFDFSPKDWLGSQNQLSVVFNSAEEGCCTCGILKGCIKGTFDIKNPSDYDIIPGEAHTPRSNGSRESTSWAKIQLENCVKTHDDCNAASERYLPTRVLDVGRDGTDVKVVETREGDKGKYFALSHCWGDPDHMTSKLTVHTQVDYKAGIPVASLPQTFRDAVEFTRTMEIQYLWADSLCIIQREDKKDTENDRKIAEEDWKRESGKMCSVYQNSYLTLAAASASGCRGGLFYSPRRPEFEGKMPGGLPYRIFAREEAQHYSSGFPLMKRGWAFQERLLSPRTLYFGKQELLWQCRKHSTCQCTGLEGWDEEGDSYPDFIKAPLQDHPSLQDNPICKWHQLVQVYSTTDLSHQTDKLAAVEGLAQYINPKGEHEYLAGLWVDSLGRDLLWRAEDPWGKRRLKRTEQVKPPPVKNNWSSDKWLFPTWSWASVNGHIFWDSDGFLGNATAEVFPAHRCNEQDTGAPYKLRLEGIIVRAKLKDVKTSLNGTTTFFQDYELGDDRKKGFISEDATVHCLRVLEFKLEREYASLVLYCVNKTEQLYERIGILRFEGGPANLPGWWEYSKNWKPERKCITLT